MVACVLCSVTLSCLRSAMMVFSMDSIDSRYEICRRSMDSIDSRLFCSSTRCCSMIDVSLDIASSVVASLVSVVMLAAGVRAAVCMERLGVVAVPSCDSELVCSNSSYISSRVRSSRAAGTYIVSRRVWRSGVASCCIPPSGLSVPSIIYAKFLRSWESVQTELLTLF